jgi:decaprenyl-phosphate phosphoribosyltransferase
LPIFLITDVSEKDYLVSMKSYIDLLRIHQYSKNLFIFLPLFFSLHLQDTERLFKVFIAFLGFCLLASAVYIFNDLYDIEVDRQHPKKKYRPLPAGKITKGSAIGLMTCLLTLGLFISYILSLQMFYLCLLYIALNLVYSVKLKHIPILDIMTISVCFVIRIFVGGAVGDVHIYMWIVIMTFLLALFMALGKRRDDVIIFTETSHMPRKSIDGY